MSSSKVPAGSALAAALAHGGELVLEAGEHAGGLLVEADVALRGEPGAVLDGGRRGPVILVDADGLTVTAQDLTLRNGGGEAGGGLRVSGWSEVRFDRCIFEANHATLAGGGSGGGVYLHRGHLTLVDCIVRDNASASASALCVTGAARAEVRGGVLAGDVLLTEAAELTLDGVHVTGKVIARGTTTRAPTLVLRGARLDHPVENDSNLPATVVVEAG
jgi:nitrous oxidase accessory protein NosD